ncbi:serine/threonine-protein kinase [Cronbergia sp. UHCC 0137]|uniref:serine/threonine-protein kinase n=1 Tax=Cronbergia sp. UHCC 0137 TaxID=3110239 RepID=UPI002B1EFDEA|nr:serine/threonine-protein kinase [Cronbergia sp. UHCC 0137]MEA5616333.1 serine/threonine-protein kinase [Cronbergia sp. UHCC 0137]
MIGKVLHGQYQVLQGLSAGVFGQTYIAIDLHYPEKPKYVVKQLKVNHYQSSYYFDYLRLRFLTETETLKHLGKHNQIPELITCFEENERYYLVQEFIPGHPLTEELPLYPHGGRYWSEGEVLVFLEDALEILEFVHSQGFIHCDIKPENLIRRAADGKLVLIDFGSIQPIDFTTDLESSIDQIPLTSLGYIPPEQFIGQTKPNSDLYALGMVAIQALTGLAPLQLQVDPATNEIMWQSQNNPVDDDLAAVLSQMIRYDYKERFQSATEALRVVRQVKWGIRPAKKLGLNSQLSLEVVVNKNYNFPSPTVPEKSSSLLAGLRLGLTINSLVIGLGISSLVKNSLNYSETDVLHQAREEYQTGDLQKAISLAESIPAHSNVYPEAQSNLTEWQRQWQTVSEQYLLAEAALNEGRWSDVLRHASKIPNNSYWQPQANNLIKQAQINIQAQTQDLLSKAYQKAENRDFSAALYYLRQIPPESYAGTLVQRKLVEYSQKRQMRAGYFLHEAIKKASVNDFGGAIELLKKIPEDSTVYQQAQIKLREYSQKVNSQGNNGELTISNLVSISNSQATSLQQKDHLLEVNIGLSR